jgi:hypothetical protein
MKRFRGIKGPTGRLASNAAAQHFTQAADKLP